MGSEMCIRDRYTTDRDVVLFTHTTSTPRRRARSGRPAHARARRRDATRSRHDEADHDECVKNDASDATRRDARRRDARDDATRAIATVVGKMSGNHPRDAATTGDATTATGERWDGRERWESARRCEWRRARTKD